MDKSFALISLGCAKNLVNSEQMLYLMSEAGYTLVPEADGADLVIVNTCGFIDAAKSEAIDTILEMAELKKAGRLGGLIVTGCLSERYRDSISEELPEIDTVLGVGSFGSIVEAADAVMEGRRLSLFGDSSAPIDEIPRVVSTGPGWAYLRIAEGCNNFCAFCAIPFIRGRYRSRRMEDIVEEARDLAAHGVKELIVIAQDITRYGTDLYGKRSLAALCRELAKIDGVEWIRLHYGYPSQFPFELLDVMREKPNVCKYIDIALQHISDNMLGRMHRHVSKEDTYELIRRIRKEVPGIHLRTTLMVGFPGETDEDFRELIEFVKWARFERMGAFAYSEEDGTYSGDNYEDDVPEDVKYARLDKLMAVQQRISAEIEAEKTGKIIKTIIDRKEGDYYVGRTEFCSPEVDPEVLIPVSGGELSIGSFYDVTITGAEEFDLYGEVR